MNRAASAVESAICTEASDSPNLFTTVARVEGDFTEQELNAAIAKIQRRHPLCRVRYISGPGGSRFEETSRAAPLRFVDRYRKEDLFREVVNELEDPCDLERGPLVRFACLRDQKICDIVMVLHHAVADGLSAVILMGDLLRYLGNPSAPVEELALQPSMGALIPKEVYDFLPPPEKILASFQSSERQGAQSVLEMPPPRFHVLHRSMDKSQLKPLLARCKENRVTVHGALGAAVLLASQAVYEDGQTTRTLQSPVSVRHLLPADLEGHFGMFITIVKEPVECHTERDFWDITRDVSGHLHELVNPQKLMMRLAATESVADYMQREGQMKLGLLKADYDASVSNLGRLTIPTEYGAVKLRSLIGPTFGANKDEKVIGVNTLDGQLNLTLCFRKKIMEPEEGERLLDLVMERLS